MSILAVCPAPFQRHKKKSTPASSKREYSKDDGALPAVKLIDQFISPRMGVIAELEEPIVREHHHSQHNISKAVEAGQSPEHPCHHQHHHPAPPVAHSHGQSYAHHHPPAPPQYHSNNQHSHHHAHCPCENDSQQSSTSNESHSTQTSGYQTDDGTFEGKMLRRATRDRPANLRMTAIRDYNPCCNEELPVRKGQRIKVLYKNNDWVYAVTKSGDAGYVPYNYVRPSRKYGGYQSEPEFYQEGGDAYQSGYETDMPLPSGRRGRRAHQIGDVVPAYSVHTGFNNSPPNKFYGIGASSPTSGQRAHLSGYTSAVEYSGSPDTRRYPRPARSMHSILDASNPQLHRPVERKPDSFDKCFLEELVVIHDFEAKEEDEVFVGKGEMVKVLNAEDPFWLWVETTPGDEGFIPRSCCSLGNHPSLQSTSTRRAARQQPERSRHARRYYYERSRQQMVARQARSQAKLRFQELAKMRSHPQNPVCMDKEEIKRVGSKLIVLMDYTATQEDELSIEFAETVFADVLKQAGAERIWAFCPRTNQCGYVPISMVVPPVV